MSTPVSGDRPTPDYNRYARLACAAIDASAAFIGFFDPRGLLLLGSNNMAGVTATTVVELPPTTRVLDITDWDTFVVHDTTAGAHVWDQVLAGAGWLSYVASPVRNSGGEVTAMLCVVNRAARTWDRDVVAIIEDIAGACSSEVQLREERQQAVAERHAAVRLEELTSDRLQQRASVAHTLQAAMLTDLPDPELVRLEAVYAPASSTEEVGGDWYDAMELGDGGLAIAVGDITGHDIEAAAVMGQMRSMLRALWWEHDKPPSYIVSLLDAVSIGTGLCATGTALLVRIEPPVPGLPLRLVWSSAGHPLPLVARGDGSVELPGGRPDPLLGFTPGCARTDRTLQLDPGDTLVMYTDGLVERAGVPLGDGISSLIEVLRSGVLSPQALLDQLAPVGLRDDDAVVLTASARV